MCGISGFYDPNGTPALLEDMKCSLNHRGPDYSSTYFDSPVGLAHNRLSIIDLSERAHQPFHYRHVVIILNGEVYNYLEIKKELEVKGYSFSTTSDTEVVAAAYIEWGEDCVQRFIGMWAFTIWNRKEKILFCSSDRFGIKPFYYLYISNRFYFGSEYKALKKAPLFDPKLNVAQVARGLQLGWAFYDSETYFECLKRLPAAHNLRFDGKNLSIYKYWDIDLSRKVELSLNEKFATFRNLFTDSVRLQMRSDVKVGSCLSGGIDSSAIASTVATLFPEASFDTFTIFYDGKQEVDERPWVNEVLKAYPNLNPYFFKPPEDDLTEAFEHATYFADIPLLGSSYLSQYFVMKLAAKQKIKVLLDGQGSDEYLAGYMHSFDRLIGDMLRNARFLKVFKTLQQLMHMHGFSYKQMLYTATKSIVSGFSNEHNFYRFAYRHKLPGVVRVPDNLKPFNLEVHPAAGRFDNFLYHLMFSTSLPTLLHFEDRNSMAFGIESRVPFLDHRLVEFTFSLGDEEKIKQGETKYILRHSMDGILPDAIKNRHDKKGFVTPGESKWLRGPLRHLLEMDFNDYNFIDNDKVASLLKAFRQGKTNSIIVWRLAALHHWLRKL